MKKVKTGRVAKPPVRANRPKVSYAESVEDDNGEDSDQLIKTEPSSFAVQSGNGNGTSSFNANMAEAYGTGFGNHHGYEDNGHEEFYAAEESMENDFGDV